MLLLRNLPPLAEAVFELELIPQQHLTLALYSMLLKMLVALAPSGSSSWQDLQQQQQQSENALKHIFERQLFNLHTNE